MDFVKPKDFSDTQASLMMSKSKELLNVAKNQNNSNEVLFIENLDFNNEVRILGDEFVVSPAKNPFAVSIIANAKRQSLVYLHNHPSTNTFSIGDIDTFVCERAIKAISVVTNQGEVYILNKLDNYSFDGTRKLLTEIYNSYPEGEIDDKDFVKKFLRRCREGGLNMQNQNNTVMNIDDRDKGRKGIGEMLERMSNMEKESDDKFKFSKTKKETA